MKTLTLLILMMAMLFGDLSSELTSKPKLSDATLADKIEGGYPTGLPLINYDSDLGMGYGARVYWYDNGAKTDTTFAYTPYKTKTFVQFFQTTNGWSYHWLNFDAPYIADSLFRLTFDAVYEENVKANYFGVNTVSEPTNTTQNYYTYKLVRPFIQTQLQHDFFGGVVRGYIKYNLKHATIDTYASSLALADAQGSTDGLLSIATVGAVYDTRDFEPNPKHGMFHEAYYQLSSTALGSGFDYSTAVLRSRFYTSILDDNLTFAMQNIYQTSNGDIPFYEMAEIAGRIGLRGYSAKRFIGKTKFQTNLEARYGLGRASGGGQTFDFMLTPFVDFGKIYDTTTLDFSDYKYTYGLGFKTIWNQATVIYVDYGMSAEGAGMYINFGHIFDSDL